jgi:hypothetical protein
MGIKDSKLRISNDESQFANGADYDSADCLDLLSAVHDFGTGLPIRFRAIVGSTAFSGGTSAAAGISDCATSGGSYVMRSLGAQIAVANLTAGALMYDIALPAGLVRYIKCTVRNVGNNSAGKVKSWLYAGR